LWSFQTVSPLLSGLSFLLVTTMSPGECFFFLQHARLGHIPSGDAPPFFPFAFLSRRNRSVPQANCLFKNWTFEISLFSPLLRLFFLCLSVPFVQCFPCLVMKGLCLVSLHHRNCTSFLPSGAFLPSLLEFTTRNSAFFIVDEAICRLPAALSWSFFFSPTTHFRLFSSVCPLQTPLVCRMAHPLSRHGIQDPLSNPCARPPPFDPLMCRARLNCVG